MPSVPTPDALRDDVAAITWVLDVMRDTDDVYLREPSAPSLETTLRDDLGLDSIGLIGVFYEVADRFDVDADESAAADWRTLRDVVTFARRCAQGEVSG